MTFRTVTLLVLFVSGAMAQDAKPDFSGTWKYETRPFATDREVDKIAHKEPDVSISEAAGRADVIYTLTYRTDGQDPKPERGLRGVERKAHWEGKTLVLETHFVRGVDITDKREELSLSDDGKTMIKRVRVSGAKGNSQNRIEFKKVSAGISGIKPGDNEATVRYEWGDPDSVEHRANGTVFVYEHQAGGPFEIIFVDGKMTDAMYRKFDKAAKDAIP